MTSEAVRKVLVIGGNGFIGSAICRAALAKGIDVTSISSSGHPYTTPKGHSPAWTSKVKWMQGNALRPSTFSSILSDTDGVVHTLGTLIEGAKYKQALANGDLDGILNSLFGSTNPLSKVVEEEKSYNTLNRDSALRVCEAYMSSGANKPHPSPRPFVYISAEDFARPFIPAGYIKSKREAEQGIEALLAGNSEQYRGVYVRPSLVYHAHFRPLTTPPATLLDLSAALHAKLPIPGPATMLRRLATSEESPLASIANALEIPPIHVDHVAEAVARALEQSELRGVLGVRQMRNLIGWNDLVEAESSTTTESM